MDSEKQRVVPITEADLPAVAWVHLASFPESALTKLGRGAVERYYRWQLLGPHECTALGVWTDNKLVGFCFGGVFRGALGGFVQENRFYLAGQTLCRPWLLSNPIFRDRLQSGWASLRRIMRRKRSVSPITKQNASIKKIQCFGILSIAVHPGHAGSGLGRWLMQEAERVAREKGFEAMDLSVHPDNVVAVQFYERLKWEKVFQKGSWQGVMKKALSN